MEINAIGSGNWEGINFNRRSFQISVLPDIRSDIYFEIVGPIKYNQLIFYEISNHGLKSMEKRYTGKSFWSKNKIKNKRLFLDMTEKTSCGTCSSDFIKMKNSQENKNYSQTCISRTRLPENSRS
jgi:hypothetical protein